MRWAAVTAVLALAACQPAPVTEVASDTLPSWRDGPSRQAIVAFVERVTDRSSPDFVPQAERIAVFDNDGTLWAEQPLYFQLLFAVERAGLSQEQAHEVLAGGTHAILELVMETHAGMTSAEFDAIASEWIASARHPETGRAYTDMVYQPMLELLAYLRDHGFSTYIVSGGGIDFMRPWTEEVYGIPPEQVVGSSIVLSYLETDAGPVLDRQAEVDFIDDGPGKPVGIQRHIGRRPILAFGNSDGDHEMLRWTAAGDGPSLMGLVHHTDAEREWAYDRDSHIGRLDEALDQARADGWVVVDMAADWGRVFPD